MCVSQAALSTPESAAAPVSGSGLSSSFKRSSLYALGVLRKSSQFVIIVTYLIDATAGMVYLNIPTVLRGDIKSYYGVMDSTASACICIGSENLKYAEIIVSLRSPVVITAAAKLGVHRC